MKRSKRYNAMVENFNKQEHKLHLPHIVDGQNVRFQRPGRLLRPCLVHKEIGRAHV